MVAPIFSRRFRQLIPALCGLALAAAPALALPELRYVERSGPIPLQSVPPLPPASQYPVQLVLDDDSWEGVFGFGGQTSEQFLWFNRFASPGPFTLEEIWVLFPQGEAAAGDDIELAVYRDADGDPANGAELLATYAADVLVADNNTFSVYPLATPLEVDGGGEVWIGVINRWVIPGITPLSAPATVDTDSNLGFSGYALWAGSPPEPPDLATATSIGNLADTPAAGTFLVRAFGTSLATVEVPALDHSGLALFAVLLTAAALGLLFRRA